MNQRTSIARMARELAFAGLAIAATALPAAAQVVSFNFTGTIDFVSDPDSVLPADITTGISYAGTITYEISHLQDSVPGDPSNGVYSFQNAAANDFSMSVTLGTHTLTYNASPILPNYIQAQLGQSNHLQDYGARYPKLDGTTPPGNLVDWGMNVTLWDSTKTALTSDALPTTAPDLSKFNNPIFQFMANNGADNFEVSGPITAITPVPEPASAALAAGAALLAVGVCRRRRNFQP